MKRIITFLVVIAMVVCFSAPAMAATTTADTQAGALQSGWSDSSYASGYYNSWFWRVLSNLVSIKTKVGTIFDKLSGVYDNVRSMVSDVSVIKTNVNTYLPDINSNLTSIKNSVSTNSSVSEAVKSINTAVDGIKTDIHSVSISSGNIQSVVTDMKTLLTDIRTSTGYLHSTAEDIHLDTGELVISNNHIDTNLSSLLSDFSLSEHDIATLPNYFYWTEDYNDMYVSGKKGSSNVTVNYSYGGVTLSKGYSKRLPEGYYYFKNCRVKIDGTWVGGRVPDAIDDPGCVVRCNGSMIQYIEFNMSTNFHGRNFVPQIKRIDRVRGGTNGLLTYIASSLNALQYVIADPATLDAKRNNSAAENQATEDFFNGSDSSTSLGTGGLKNIKGFGDSVASLFGSGASAGDIGSALGDAVSENSGLQWFTQAVADDLDSVVATYSDDTQDIVTNYYQENSDAVAAWFTAHPHDEDGD